MNGVQWVARTMNNNEHLAEDTPIVVCRQEGNICIVEKID
ncbi:MAG: NfeD family protein [Proteobacteria bacterium]|nr:NfeD family protein [Pseudomonadota bacterium]